jgi:beta-phosphoglucomutase-like phosphatase (HAD superfamily)
VEDSRSGIEAAHRAGIGCIVALGPAHTHEQLARLAGVNEVIENLGQFPKQRLL